MDLRPPPPGPEIRSIDRIAAYRCRDASPFRSAARSADCVCTAEKIGVRSVCLNDSQNKTELLNEILLSESFFALRVW